MMKTLLLGLALTLSYAHASPLGPLSRLVNTEEHLIHREQAGPYLVNGDGQRLVERPYLKLDIRHDGERIPPTSDVRVDATLHHQGEVSTVRYTPEARDGLFVIDPLELPGAETWSWDSGGWLELELFIDGPAGEGQGRVSFHIYPPKPETGRLFGLVNFAIPFVLLALFAAVFGLRRVRLQRYSV